MDELKTSYNLQREVALVYVEDNEGNDVFSVDVLNCTISEAWGRTDKSVSYKEFCKAAQLARWAYNKELRERSEKNAHSYAKFWAGTKGKPYGHYRKEYGA